MLTRMDLSADVDGSAPTSSGLSPSPRSRFPGYPREPLDEAAETVKAMFDDARFVDVPDEAPSVFAEYPGPGPTVLLYAHYDVQPAPPEGWDTDPFTPVVRDGRLYGRGAADDKSGIVAHLAALRANCKRPHVKVLIEGSEENGRQKLLEVVDRDPELMRADVFVVADGGNWKLGEPTLCETLRGHGKLTVTLRTLENALHSGQFGGAAPDALLALTRMLATLHDDDGAVAVDGLEDSDWDGADLPEADFRRQAGVLDGVALTGDRLGRRPAVGAPRDLRARRRRARRRGRRQHRDPGRAGEGRGAGAAGRRSRALDGACRGAPARRRAVGRADRDRGRAGVDADRAAAARTPPSARSRPRTASRSRGWAAAARSRSWRGCATPTRRRRSCCGARRTPTWRGSTPPTSRSTSTRWRKIALAEALLLEQLG